MPTFFNFQWPLLLLIREGSGAMAVGREAGKDLERTCQHSETTSSKTPCWSLRQHRSPWIKKIRSFFQQPLCHIPAILTFFSDLGSLFSLVEFPGISQGGKKRPRVFFTLLLGWCLRFSPIWKSTASFFFGFCPQPSPSAEKEVAAVVFTKQNRRRRRLSEATLTSVNRELRHVCRAIKADHQQRDYLWLS